MGPKKMFLVFTICAALGIVTISAQMTSQQRLMTFKQQIRNCLGQHICSLTVTATTTAVACVAKEKVCDGTNDCTDNSDEANCVRCAVGEVLCPDTYTCAKPCDGIKQCKKAEDEKGCPTTCKHGEMLCNDRVKCAKVCNRIKECTTGEDEEGCPKKCDADQILCRDKVTCAKPCDDMEQCPTKEDEHACPFQCKCPDGQYICRLGNKCVVRANVCEGTDSDATSCSTKDKGDDEDPNEAGVLCT